eukprot:TRINITY_DN59127_c0_g1_i1.p2 TRINITY_DN59127_c0_g1~~TRINITY_DN59127_c0_g1_i1.p2  ORF type:complete len:181 (-),score=26.01 TRINITY_DN59127_c0_g1_i1:6-548(-)
MKSVKKGERLWLGSERDRRMGEKMLDLVGPQYDIQYSWNGTTSSAKDSLRLVLWAQSKGKNEEFMSSLGWLHFSCDKRLADHGVLLDAVEDAGLDRQEAHRVLKSNDFTQDLQTTMENHLLDMISIGPGGAIVGGLPVFVFWSTNPKLKYSQPWRLQGSQKQEDFENILMEIETTETRAF